MVRVRFSVQVGKSLQRTS